MPLIETKGAASAQGFGEFLQQGPVNYIEDVFSTYLYNGNGSTQTITNNIDLSGKGGLVWIKPRIDGPYNVNNIHALYDTVRGASNGYLNTASSAGVNSNGSPDAFDSFLSMGFSLDGSVFPGAQAGAISNTSVQTYASWTFRKQSKFFDVVTYTGNGVDGRTISHNLGSTPGFMLVKCTSNGSTNWLVYHRSAPNGIGGELLLNSTAAASTLNCATGGYFGSITSTSFRVFQTDPNTGNNVTPTEVNVSGYTYVAYLFAHNAGGFGLTNTDNVISCGSFTTDGSGNATVTLGYEPQWILAKRSDGSSNWRMVDTMRGWPVGSDLQILYADSSLAEGTDSPFISLNATGFKTVPGNITNSSTWIYIAIRRGPMKVPTSGTSVFGLSARTGTGANATVTGSAGVSDAVLIKNRGSAVGDLFASRLTGTGYLETSSTAAEVAAGTTILQANPWDVMDGVKVGTTSTITNASANTYINYLFDRAPGFFDVVCYTGTGSATTQAHNLGVAPELLIVKSRNTGATRWCVGSSALGGWGSAMFINTNAAVDIFSGIQFNSTAPTSTVFTVGSGGETNVSAYTYVAYLFASCPGVSKVGSYTGTGALQTVNCGFTGGARFVLIKRTDSTGDWYVYDSARGISSGNDPYLLLNSTAAEVTGTNYVDTDSTGFKVTAAAPAGLNANGGSFVFLAIA